MTFGSDAFPFWATGPAVHDEFRLPEGRYASDAPFVPRTGSTEEDDGYLVSFVTDESSGTSECALLDARRIEDGPVCRIALPHKRCSGAHSCWADRKFIRAGMS